MKVILAGGGTGGHLYPGIAVAEKLHEKGIDTLFLVSNRGIEKKVLDKLGYKYVEQDVEGFSGVPLGKKITAIQKLRKAIESSSKLIDKGDKILLLGGFAAAPAAVAGAFRGIDIYIHEQNSVMGMVNKLIGSQARRIFTSYPVTSGAPARSIVVGNPVRKELLHGTIKTVNEKRILIVGGSSGSRKINMLFAGLGEQLISTGYKVYHQTGEKLYEETKDEYEKKIDADGEKLIFEPYITDMKKAYADTDIIITRAGSGAVFEVTYARRPAIYIPFSAATGNHQFYNAESMRRKGYCKVIDENTLTPELMCNEIENMFENIEKYKLALESVEPLDSAALIIKHMGL